MQSCLEEYKKDITPVVNEWIEASKTQKKSFRVSDNAVDPMPQQFLRLMNALDTISEEVLFISIGSAIIDHDRKQQQLPTYIKHLARDQQVRALLIDGMFDSSPSPDYKKTSDKKYINRFERLHRLTKERLHDDPYTYSPKQQSGALNINVFSCMLPTMSPVFYKKLEDAITGVLNRGGRVFIANHTQAWSLEWIPEIGNVYNHIKTSHPNAAGLQLYTQGGCGKVRCYLDNLYDPATSNYRENKQCDLKKSTLSEFRKNKEFEPIGNEFYLCNNIDDLESVYEAENQPRPPLMGVSKNG